MLSLVGNKIQILILHYILAAISMSDYILETFRYYSRRKPGTSRTPEKNVKSNSQTVVV